VIADAFRCPTWAFCSRLVCLVASFMLWLAPRGIPRRVSSVDDFEPFVLGDVGVVLDVQRGGWQFADKAAGGDPGVVGRSRSSAELGVGLDLASADGDVLVVGEDDECGEVRIGCAGPSVHLVSSP
jgi:hypothetical protein